MGVTHRAAATQVLTEDERLAIPVPTGVSLGKFVGFDAEGRFQVDLADGGEPVCALSTVGLGVDDAGAPVAVAYEQGHAGRFIIIGRLREHALPTATGLKIDGERLVIHAEREIELRCGDASIVLTRAGKVLIRGNYIQTRSRGANKIKGAYVDIN